MSLYLSHEIDYTSAIYKSADNMMLEECGVIEDWNERPASAWAVGRIGLLQSKVEKFKYLIYHNRRYGKHDISSVIPGATLRQFANESFGFDGWRMEVMQIEVREAKTSPPPTATEGAKVTILAEAEVKISLKDGTNTRRKGFSCVTMPSKGEAYGRAKKAAVNDALKRALLSFEHIIMEHEAKIENKYYVDGPYKKKTKE